MPINTRDLQRLMSGADVATFAAAQAELGASLRQFTESVLQTSRIMELAAQVSHTAETVAQLSILETTRLDEVLATMSRLAAPEIEQLVESQLEEWREAGVWAPELDGQAGEVRVEAESDDDVDDFAVLHESLTHAIVEQSKLTADTEVQLVSLLAFVALATGNWVLALFFALDLLRHDELARRPTTITLRESKRDWDVSLEWDEEGNAWVTFVPALNNISTFGSTREEALERTHEAIRGYLTAAAKRGIPIPEAIPRQQSPLLARRPRAQTLPA